MNKRNFALLSVLYDTEGSDLYHDIYFPIIQYILATKCAEQIEQSKYYNVEEIQNDINSLFGIKMPLVVLMQCINAVSKNNDSFSITTYEKGKSFLLNPKRSLMIDNNISYKMEQVVNYFEQLEKEFKSYLKEKSIEYNKTFLDFFIDNSEDIFKYLHNSDSDICVNENYLHISNFLLDLKCNKIELFNIANDIFWGSCVAAFLRRDVDINIKPQNSVDYYLDSALVLSLLDLDCVENVLYAKELVDIIIKSGNRVIVNSMTLREIDSILNAVEKAQHPNPNTAIADAYYRRKLSPSKILTIRHKLRELIESYDVIVCGEPENALDDIISNYKNKTIVKKLSQSRGLQSSENNFREIHDLYLYDYVSKKNGNVINREKVKCFFVSINNNLIQFIRDNNPNIKILTIIHPAKVITELWIHSSKSTIIRKNGLIEVISRCIALNNTDVRYKLRLLAKYLNEDDLSKDIYSALYNSLVSRSHKVLQEIVKISDMGELTDDERKKNSDVVKSTIQIAIEEYKCQKEEIKKNNTKINEVTKQLEDTNAELRDINESFKNQVNITNSKQSEIDELKFKVNYQEEENKKLKQTIKIKELEDNISNVNNQLKNFDEERQNNTNLTKYYIQLLFEIIVLLVLIISIFFSIYFIIEDYKNEVLNISNIICYLTSNKLKILALIIPIFTFLLCIPAIDKLIMLSPKISKLKVIEEQQNYWEKNHPEYKELLIKKRGYEKELEMYKNKLI